MACHNRNLPEYKALMGIYNNNLVVDSIVYHPFILRIQNEIFSATLIIKLSQKHFNFFILRWKSILPG